MGKCEDCISRLSPAKGIWKCYNILSKYKQEVIEDDTCNKFNDGSNIIRTT
jgi:hypothetical protein